MNTYMRVIRKLMAGTALAIIPAMAMAQAPANTQDRALQSYQFDVPARSLGDALRTVASQAGLELYVPSNAVSGRAAPALHEKLQPIEAIARLLAGTGLSARIDGGAIIIRGRTEAGDFSSSTTQSPEILVTGSHIRGAQIAAPVTVIHRQDIESAGQNDMGEVVRSLPMNFNGGQNPGVASGGAITNTNVNSGSSINLRGLGADATLTLLNGHRMPQDSAVAGVDISAIPVAAIDRIEVVADGASAIYGSDAVGGVANVVLRRDFEGVVTSARIGGSTEGGNFQNQEGIVAGHHWRGGGLMVTYDHDQATALTAGQRPYASNMSATSTLLPAQERHAVVVTGHQAIGDNLTFTIDGLYNRRTSAFRTDSTTAGAAYSYFYAPTLETFSIAPELAIALPHAWQSKIAMSYGKDITRYNTTYAPSTGSSTLTTGCYCDRAVSAEINADGPLFRLPGGSAHVALGGGYRSNAMDYSRALNGSQTGAFSVNRESYYAYGELALPLLKPHQPVPFLKSLSLSAAARYENYPGLAHLTTPKFGLTYEPDRNITFKASWGRSFKAPTLYQQYVGYQTLLLAASSYGAGPAGKTFLYLGGGNPDLKPERARSWTAGFDAHPTFLPGFTMEVSYFNIHYTDRAVQPISGTIGSAFTTAGYASLLASNPSAATISNLAAGSLYGLQNLSGLTYDATNVITLVDNRYRNVAQQQLDGIDFALHYRHALAGNQMLMVNASSTYLKSTQQLTSDLPTTQLSGIVFNPAKWRARGGATWQGRDLSLSSFINYTGNLSDTRYSPATTISSYTTLDLTGTLKLRLEQRAEPSVEVTLAILNLFNRRPQLIRTASSVDTPYDSTNSSPVGRFVSLGLSRKW